MEEPPPGEVEELAAAATYSLLRERGLQVKLPNKVYEKLSRLAARREVPVEQLVARWIKDRLRQEKS